MHNTAWHLDPDTLVLREEYSTVEQARTRVSFVALTGTLFTVGDPVDALDAPRVEMLRRAMPPAELHPAEMVRRSSTPDVGITLTAVCRHYGEWFVVGLYNLTDREATARFDPQRHGLPPGRYAVYDFWEKRYLGVRSGAIRRKLPPGGCAVWRFTPVGETPELVACTGHILQGADELSEFRQDRGVISGKVRAAAKETVILGFRLPPGFAVDPAPGLTVKGDFAELRITPKQSGPARWRVRFHKDPARVRKP